MPDPIETTEQQPIEPVPTAETLSAELETLRRANAEILTKRQKDKEKLAAMEVAAIASEERATKAEAATHNALIEIPLRRMAEDISQVPTLWLEKFNDHFKLESKDEVLTILSKDGNIVKDSKGQAVKFSFSELSRYLTESEPESERTKLFKVLTIVSKASGAAGGNSNGSKPPKSNSGGQFGLR